MRMLDMHAHPACFSEGFAEISLEQELALRRESGIATCFSGGTPQEWETLLLAHEYEELLLSFGIHPWYAHRYAPQEYRDAFKSCDVIGEIGMDSVWCGVSLDVQQRNLEKQLEIAADFHKPVLLHTKGQEMRIAEMLRGFPQPICVHWYSGDRKAFEAFLELDCYFTLGPDYGDLRSDNDFEEVCVNRLFLETDGISAVAWARGVDTLPLEMLPEVLDRNQRTLAVQRSLTPEGLHRQMCQNLCEFLTKS